MPVIDPIALLTEADEQIKSVRTSVKDFSFNELLSMYEDKELIINPDFQRLFRWTEEKESRLIESLILELPLPPIYVIELPDGKYDLIDGLQRISSYMHFRGVLHAPHRDIAPGDFLTLYECDIIRRLNDLNYESLPEAFKIKLKRASIKMEIIRKESDARLRYHMFKRLNSGGIGLEQQEIRNCTIRLLGNTYNQFMIDCSKSVEFKNCVSVLSKNDFDKAFDQELVLSDGPISGFKRLHDIGTRPRHIWVRAG